MVWKDRRELPGLALMMVAVLVLVGCVTAIAIGNAVWATGLAVVLVGAAAGGLSWMLIGRRRTGRAGKHRRAR